MFGANSHEGSFVYATVYNSFLEPNGYTENPKFLREDLVHQLLQTVEIGNSYPVEYMVQDAYFQVYHAIIKSIDCKEGIHEVIIAILILWLFSGLADGRLGADATRDH